MSVLPTQFDETKTINEGSTAKYSLPQLQDEDGVSILLADIDSLTITLCNLADGTEINSRTDQNALNANNVVVTTGGTLTFNIQAADTIIVDGTLASDAIEVHRATFKMRFNSISFSNWDIDLPVRNLKSQP